MSRENVEIVRSLFAGWERGDFSSTEWAHPDIEFVIGDGPSAGTWWGLAGMAEGFREFIRDWEGWRAEAQEYFDLDHERVLVLNRVSGRGKVSGLELRQLTGGASLYHVRGGKVIRLVVYLHREHALADLGLATESSRRE
jgi:ketosteroid isomerase-like protein